MQHNAFRVFEVILYEGVKRVSQVVENSAECPFNGKRSGVDCPLGYVPPSFAVRMYGYPLSPAGQYIDDICYSTSKTMDHVVYIADDRNFNKIPSERRNWHYCPCVIDKIGSDELRIVPQSTTSPPQSTTSPLPNKIKELLASAKQGKSTAMVQVGMEYAQLSKSVRDQVQKSIYMQEAVYWWQEAANYGNARGKLNIGIYYANSSQIGKAHQLWQSIIDDQSASDRAKTHAKRLVKDNIVSKIMKKGELV